MVDGDFLTRWNVITVRKGREKGQGTFQVKARLYVNFIAVRKYNFLDSFLCCFVYKVIFANDLINLSPKTILKALETAYISRRHK